MAKRSMFFTRPDSARAWATDRDLLGSGVLALALLLAACASDTVVEIENTQAARELARQSRPKGSVSVGWRMFQSRCSTCHGQDATGTSVAPDLLPLVGQMGPRRFVGLVLERYDWDLPPTQAGQERDALVEGVLQGKGPVFTMPAWEDNPAVSAHIADLYAYLAARADGTQGRGRPLP